MLRPIKDPFFSKQAKVHSGFNFFFHQVARRPLTSFVLELRLRLRLRFRGLHRSVASSLRRKMESAKQRHAARQTREGGASPYVVVFTGHSQGGALAQYGAWFLSKELCHFIREGRVAVYAVTFASPPVSLRGRPLSFCRSLCFDGSALKGSVRWRGRLQIGDALANEELSRYGAAIHSVVNDVDPVPQVNIAPSKPYLHLNKESLVSVRALSR